MKVYAVDYFNNITGRYLVCGIFETHKDALHAIENLVREEIDSLKKDYPWISLSEVRDHYQISEYELGVIKNGKRLLIRILQEMEIQK